MTHANPQFAPDFEERYTLALALLEFLGVDAALVQLDSLTIQLADDRHHVVTWTGRTRLDTDELRRIIDTADAKADAR